MKSIIISIILSFCSSQIFSQTIPDLVPILAGKLYGYSDKNLHVKIKPQYDNAQFFEEDFDFQIMNVNNPAIVQYGTADYAWVELKGEKYRIDKRGKIVYQFKQSDFKKESTLVIIEKKAADYSIDSIDRKTLFPYLREKKTDKLIFPQDSILNITSEQNGIRFVVQLQYPELPYTYFIDEKTLLSGEKNTKTGKVLVKPKYKQIDELFNNPLNTRQYLLLRCYSYSYDKAIYVDLYGKEFVIPD